MRWRELFRSEARLDPISVSNTTNDILAFKEKHNKESFE